MRTVAIIGVGLIGGSFGLGLRAAGFEGEVLGVSSPGALEAGLSVGAITRAAEFEEAVEAADLIYLAQPVNQIVKTLERLSGRVRPECLVTDAGSTKSVIVAKARECLEDGVFLGGHPMAGKEQRGAEAADGALFRGRKYVLTPTAPATRQSTAFREWLNRLGAVVVEMSPEEHDATVAFTSHLPQLISTALAGTLSKQANPHFREVFGSGLLDMTRLALSTAELWESILSTNRKEVQAAVEIYVQYLTQLAKAIDSKKLPIMFFEGKELSQSLRNATNKAEVSFD